MYDHDLMSGIHQQQRLVDGGLASGDLPHADLRIGVPSEEGVAVGGPGERDARDRESLGLGVGHGELELELIHDTLALEVPDADAVVGGSAEPVPVGGEAESVDDVTLLAGEGVEALALVEIPEHGHTVLAAGGTEGAVGGDSDGVDVAGVPDEVGAKLAVGKLPHLDELVPAAGHDERVGGVGGEGHAGDPLGVALGAVGLDGVLALAAGVPKLDGLVAGARHDLTVVGGEGDGEDILLVADKGGVGGTEVEVPETEGAVPGAGEGELAIGRDDNILHEVGVATEGLLGVTVVAVLTGEGPPSRTCRGKPTGSCRGSRWWWDGGHPPSVPLKAAAHSEVGLLRSHGRSVEVLETLPC